MIKGNGVIREEQRQEEHRHLQLHSVRKDFLWNHLCLILCHCNSLTLISTFINDPFGALLQMARAIQKKKMDTRNYMGERQTIV